MANSRDIKAFGLSVIRTFAIFVSVREVSDAQNRRGVVYRAYA